MDGTQKSQTITLHLLDYWTPETRVSENERRTRLIGERGRRAFQFDNEWL
jgi:hypothetical protein